MGSEESHFNVSVGILSDGQSHKTVPTNHSLSEEKGEPKRYRTEVLLLTTCEHFFKALPLGQADFPILTPVQSFKNGTTGSHFDAGPSRLPNFDTCVTL